MKEEVLGPEHRVLDPHLNRFTGRRGDLKLHGLLRLPLQHDFPRCDLIAVGNVAHLQSD